MRSRNMSGWLKGQIIGMAIYMYNDLYLYNIGNKGELIEGDASHQFKHLDTTDTTVTLWIDANMTKCCTAFNM
jgi:hypothetical protein